MGDCSFAELKNKFPGFSIRNVMHTECYKEAEKLAQVVSALRIAGLPE
jgi:hypothetical protein